MDDKYIIDLYWARSESAIEATQEKYGSYCNKIAFNILGNAQDTEECVSDSYFKVWGALPPNRPNCLRTFIGKITRNLAIDRYDKNHAEKRGGGQELLVLDELAECIPSPETNVDGQEITQCLNNFLASLKAEDRKLFVRRYWYVDSIEDLKDAFGYSESKVKTTLFRLREKLKEELEKEGVSL